MTTDKAHLPELPALMVEAQVRAALEEDLGRAGDITSQATIGPDKTARCSVAVREAGVVCGMTLAATAFRLIDPTIRFEAHVFDGDPVEPGHRIASVEGPARGVLAAERVALNFLMHLSGIASHTARFAALIADTPARITCTRKTLPGLRAVEKFAVRCGGGSSHRYGLDDAILIKDNHIAVCGGIAASLNAARAFAGHLVKIEIEVDTLEQFAEVLAHGGADVVLLDNMGADLLAEAVKMNAGRLVLEASGNVDLSTVHAIAETGVDFISTSKITMAAPTLDIGLDIAIS
ncbi:carboxylating nicotinate-nucleotide diphosphorylase [Pseudohoeflea coraliihabitans]|uniref:Quinolinate phosphoribosyltransferase [decarboxylating] n=1 Tax=Pseudohoeflea coraliihabitans TaxID=2860393 RepID=A0ABS6WPI3_9HYPH|nr:carboxylating nicotinate-nucleotide diphosphorylase [Pseudohoeflea sp. DP4N28-3]MBW3097879.1 carboxylating nicotinate-nucleotide diphosphorylase [Pseudohoeflea sp. DP4N28-3]